MKTDQKINPATSFVSTLFWVAIIYFPLKLSWPWLAPYIFHGIVGKWQLDADPSVTIEFRSDCSVCEKTSSGIINATYKAVDGVNGKNIEIDIPSPPSRDGKLALPELKEKMLCSVEGNKMTLTSDELGPQFAHWTRVK